MKFACCFLFLISLCLNASEIAERKMAWAHYVPWHRPQDISLTTLNYYNFPLLDITGHSLPDWRKEIKMAKAIGLDGFFTDLVVQHGGGTTFASDMMLMLKAAEGSDFNIGICLDHKTTIKRQISELKILLDKCAKHPNYPRWNGRPVVCTYVFLAWKPDELSTMREQLRQQGHDIFLIGNVEIGFQPHSIESLRRWAQTADMLYPFMMCELDQTSLKDKRILYEQLAREENKRFMPTVYPGYYGAWLNGRNDFYQPHEGFDTAHKTFVQAMAAQPTCWLHFTTWNDHDETSFMPMVFTPGNAAVMTSYIREFKGLPPCRKKSNVLFAYHREELPGTLIRLEAMTLPADTQSILHVSGKLLDHKGNIAAYLPEKTLKGNRFDRTEWLIPSSKLAYSPCLTPLVTIRQKQKMSSYQLPDIFLVTGWVQNGVTMKVAADECFTVASEYSIKANSYGFSLDLTCKSPLKLKRITLWRNDRPISALRPTPRHQGLLNLRVKGAGTFSLGITSGTLLNAYRKSLEYRDIPSDFKWDKNSLVMHTPQWPETFIKLQGLPTSQLTVKASSNSTRTLTFSDIIGQRSFRIGAFTVTNTDADGGFMMHAPLNLDKATIHASVYTRTGYTNDRFQLCYESMDGKLAWSKPCWPFALDTTPQQAHIVETSITRETPSNACGKCAPNHSEWLSKHVPFQTPQVKTQPLSPLCIRSGQWNFDGNGNDSLGDMHIRIPEDMFVAMGNNGHALRFTGKNTLAMRRQTYPMGAMTLSLKIKPATPRKGKQGLVTRSGWSDAVELILLPNGHLSAIRSGNQNFPKQFFTSTIPIHEGKWNSLRIICDNKELAFFINGKDAGRYPVLPGRSYGNCTWHLGKGNARDQKNYMGLMDEVTIHGAGFLTSPK